MDLNNVNPAIAGNNVDNQTSVKADAELAQNQQAKPLNGQADQKSNPNPQEHDWKKRYENTATDFKATAESLERAIEANVNLASSNPEILDAIADTDPSLADKVSMKIHGKSYADYQEAKRIETIRQKDPERATTEERLSELEKREKTALESNKKSFFESKGIIYNQFDPNFKKVEAQLSIMSKDYVANNMQSALAIAYNLAFPTGITKEDVEAAKNSATLLAQSNKAAGGSSMGDISSVTTTKRTLSAEQQGFKDKFGNLLK